MPEESERPEDKTVQDKTVGEAVTDDLYADMPAHRAGGRRDEGDKGRV